MRALERSSRASRQQLVHDFALNVGKTKISPHVPVGQSLVIQAQAMQDGGMQVVDVDPVFDHVKPEVVGLANDLARL